MPTDDTLVGGYKSRLRHRGDLEVFGKSGSDLPRAMQQQIQSGRTHSRETQMRYLDRRRGDKGQ